MSNNNVFSLLSDKLKRVIKEMGYTKPTPVQEIAIPKILEKPHENFLIVAPTGSGKTEAALLPILDLFITKRIEVEKAGVNILYVSPLRALNRDILDRIFRLMNLLGFKSEVRHGDTSASQRRRQTKKPPFLLITTPETLQAMLWGKNLRRILSTVRFVIVDEVHSLLDNKRGCQLTVGLERLRLLSDFSIIGLSATIALPNDALDFLTGGRGGIVIKCDKKKKFHVKVDAVKADLKPSKTSIIGFEWSIDLNKLARRVANIVERVKGKVLIFVNTRDLAELLGVFLKKYARFRYGVHHGSLSKEVRTTIESEFKKGKVKAIIATSSLELGIDIGDVDLVIQIMSPRRVETALQRIGRAGHRLEEVSKGIIIATNPDDLYESIAISMLLEKGKIEEILPIDKCYDVLAHQIIGIARDFYLDKGDYPTIDTVFKIIKSASPFKSIRKEEFTWILNFLQNRCKLINIAGGKISLKRGAIRYYFNGISTIPTSVKYRVFDVSENKFIGELDEQFVLKSKPGEAIILAGSPRIILEIDYSSRTVRTALSLSEAVPPRWEGELMPTSYEVAQMVGRIRKTWINQHDLDNFIRKVKLSRRAREWTIEIASYHEKDIVPDDKTIVIEMDNRLGLVVIHSNFGLNVNRTIALLLAHFLINDENFPLVGFDADAYRIYLLLYQNVFLTNKNIVESLERALNSVIDLAFDESAFKANLYQAIIEHAKEELAWYFIQVLRRFGLISATSSISLTSALMLLSKYSGSPVYNEAIHEYILNRLDIRRTIEVLRKIDSGEIEIYFSFSLSKLAIQSPPVPTFSSKDIENLILEKYYERLKNRELIYICLTCGYKEIRKASNILFVCPKCGSERITVLKKSDEEALKIIYKALKGEKLDLKELNKLRSMDAFSRFLRTLKEMATITIAGYGIGHKQAMEILKLKLDLKSLLNEIRRREILFWKTKIFWGKKNERMESS